MRIAARFIPIILLAIVGCGRSSKPPKVEIEPLSAEQPDNKERLAELHRTAEVLAKAKQYEGAENCLSEAYAMALRMSSNDSFEVADVLNNYAVLETSRQRFDLASGYLSKAEQIYRRLFQDDHPLIVNVLKNRAFVARSDDDLKNADRFELEAKVMEARLKAKKK